MITRPTLLLDKEICRTNIERMATKARQNNVTFRPHFKTHQSALIGDWFRDFGVDCITVSSVRMAEYFYKHGWTDITIAFPANILEWRTIIELASKININLVVESIETIEFLEKHLTSPTGVYLKIDTGYGRTGIAADDYESIQVLLKRLQNCKQLIFIGFLCHAGHTYNSKNIIETKNIASSAKEQMLALKTFMSSYFPLIQLSYGDTPSCSLIEDVSDFDEIRPGCFVFYDEMQRNLGACQLEDIAIALATPVVARHTSRNEVVVHGGAVHLSKDTIKDTNNINYYGVAVKLSGTKWEVKEQLGIVTKLSQEHGIIKVNDDAMHTLKIGDTIAILPIHACLTANLMKEYHTTDRQIISMMH